MKTPLLATVACAAMLAGAAAQSPRPYAGMQTRPVKALSDQQIADLKAGRGMGLALAAELNGFPGPVHLLELARKLGLSDRQRATIKGLFDAMKAEAVPIGERMIAQEADLDRQFMTHVVTLDSLKVATAAIGASQAELRNIHLKYHLTTAALLTPAQQQRYSELRGYAGGGQEQHHH